MARPLSSVRLDEHASCVFVLFIDGLRDAWTTDSSGALTGSGLGSWIYRSEVAIGGREVAGTRVVHPGLMVPDNVSFGVDLKSGAIQPSPMSFQVVDLDGELATLFATEGQTSEILGQRIAPGTTNLGSSVTIIGGAGTTNPRGRYVGLEKVGPSGQRRQWPALPFDLVGFDHAVHGSLESVRLPPVLVSDVPLEFAGRLATLYRIYRDPSLPVADATAYYTWDEAEAAGDRVWWGVLADAGNVGGNRVWSIDCHGPEALLKRTLGTRSPTTWTRVSAELTLEPEESYVAIGFACRGVAGASVERHFDASVFDHQITAVTSRPALAAQLNTWIEDALDGTDTNVAMGGGTFDGWVDAEGNAFPDAGVTSEGRFFVRRRRADVNDGLTYGVMWVAIHERAWRFFGFEPETQHRKVGPYEDVTHCTFTKLKAGEQLKPGAGTGVDVPGTGYVMAWFTTVSAGHDIEDIEAYDNDGAPRYWWPYHTSEVFVLRRKGGQVVRLIEQEPSQLYLEGQLTVGTSQYAEIESTPTERARYFALRGQVVQVADDIATEDEVEVTKAVEIHQVIKASWVEGATYGTVSEGSGIEPALCLEWFEFPKAYGLNFAKVKHDWSGKRTGKGGIEIAPLHAYRYFSPLGERPWEQADTLVSQILLSTGACLGYDAPVDDGGEIVAGPNTHPLATPFAGDYEIADLGLGIPYQLVQHPADIRAAFSSLPGGYDGDLNRLRLAYVGPFESLEVLDSITKPRLLCWSLRGKQFGLYRLGPVSPNEVDIVITEADLYGTVGDPESCIPTQNLRATGQIDGVKLSYRLDPAKGKATEEFRLRALDPGAAKRTGELVETVTDHGLCADWWGKQQEQLTGIVDWRPHFRQLWERDAPEFFAKRHFSCTLTLSRPLGQDAMPGCSVSLTNPWLVNPSGGYGVTGLTGRIVSATHNLSEGSTTVELIVFAGPTVRHYSPFVRVSSVDGTTVGWYADNLGHGGSSLDGDGFAEASWSTAGGNVYAYLHQRVGDTWSFVDSAQVVSVDLAARTMEIASPFTAWLRDRDHYLVLADCSGQDPGAWPTTGFGVVTDLDLTVGDGTTPGTPFSG